MDTIKKCIGTVILAAGNGERFGTKWSSLKQFTLVMAHGKGVNMVDVAIKKYRPISCKIVLVIPGAEYTYYEETVECVFGGKTRLESLICGVEYLRDDDEITHVIIAEPVRPFTSSGLIQQLLYHINKYDIVISTAPCYESLLEVPSHGTQYMNIDRERYRICHNPTMWKKETLCELVDIILEKGDGGQYSEINHAVKYMSDRIKFIPDSHEDSMKITFPREFVMFENYVRGNKGRKEIMGE